MNESVRKEDNIKREETACAVELRNGKASRRSRGRMDYTLRVKVTSDSQPVAVALIEAKGKEVNEALAKLRKNQ